MLTGTTVIVIAIVLACYMGWNIGANDVANAMGTSVGSGAVTFKQAIVIAAVLEFAGAILVGGNVTNTVRKGIVDPSFFCLGRRLHPRNDLFIGRRRRLAQRRNL